jgi:radial spoke head protein 4/6
VARRIKIFFTGNLNADVKTYPKFVGKEKHLLKAQLVRITHAAQIGKENNF